MESMYQMSRSLMYGRGKSFQANRKYEFSRSVQDAIRFVLELREKGKTDLHPDLVKPDWDNYPFFSQISLGTIRRHRDNSAGVEILERIIRFWGYGGTLADLHMVTRQPLSSKMQNSHGEWKIIGVRYTITPNDLDSERWVEVSLCEEVA